MVRRFGHCEVAPAIMRRMMTKHHAIASHEPKVRRLDSAEHAAQRNRRVCECWMRMVKMIPPKRSARTLGRGWPNVLGERPAGWWQDGQTIEASHAARERNK